MRLTERFSGHLVERRCDERRSVLLEALAQVDGREIRAVMLNISRSGAMLAAADRPEAGVQISILVNKGEISGRVIWAEGYRFGLSFDRQLSQPRFDAIVEHAHYDGRAR